MSVIQGVTVVPIASLSKSSPGVTPSCAVIRGANGYFSIPFETSDYQQNPTLNVRADMNVFMQGASKPDRTILVTACITALGTLASNPNIISKYQPGITVRVVKEDGSIQEVVISGDVIEFAE